MREPVGRLAALDPEESQPLQVVAYFDTLLAGGARLDALLRGAAVLTGAVAGAELHGHVSRRSPDGRIPQGEPLSRSPRHPCSAGEVWLERAGPHHANDEMVVDRLAFALDLIEARREPVGALEIAVDPTRTVAERTIALARLRVEPGSRIRIVATWSDSPPAPSSVVVPTRYGLVRAQLCRADEPPATTPAGLGPWVRADHAPDSWAAAVIALRLTDPAAPVVDATDLGALLMLAREHDPQAPHADVVALSRLDARTAQVLQTLVERDSMRAAAATLGMHHSTLQARHEALTRELGYDPRTALGKVRYAAAEFLLRLTDLRDA